MQGQHTACTCTCSSEGAMVRKSGKAPALIACAEVMMAHCCAWRNMWRRSMTGTTPEWIAAANTDPGPTGANWSGSPAKQFAALNLHLLTQHLCQAPKSSTKSARKSLLIRPPHRPNRDETHQRSPADMWTSGEAPPSELLQVGDPASMSHPPAQHPPVAQHKERVPLCIQLS